jgi:hypothetical protein
MILKGCSVLSFLEADFALMLIFRGDIPLSSYSFAERGPFVLGKRVTLLSSPKTYLSRFRMLDIVNSI